MLTIHTHDAHGACIACGAWHDHAAGCPFAESPQLDPYAELEELEVAA